jgi:hypothetical protein
VGTVIDNPQKSGINTSEKVAQVVRNGGTTWAGSYLTLNNKIDFTNLGFISMKVFSPKAGMPVLFKLEGDVGPSEVSIKTTKVNEWETLIWNFTGKPSNVYNKLVFMFDFGIVGNGSANSTFLVDDIKQQKTITTINDIGLSTISIYPNPANKILYIGGLKEDVNVTIIDLIGKIVINKVAINQQLDISNLPSGIYMVRIGASSGIIPRKFIKQ